MTTFINLNGKIADGSAPAIRSTDHSYRYGDGLFETMRVRKGKILYSEYHFERLFSGLDILHFKRPIFFTSQNLTGQILNLCEKNNCAGSARIRLSVSRGNGGLYDCDDNCSYLIECWPLERKGLNENGLIVDVFPGARKSIDAFSSLKSANYLSYTMAALWAKENKLNDALILNSNGRICDATIANVFWAKDDKLFTPPLSEGGIAGVMRRTLMETSGSVIESVLTEKIFLDADEVFLTNVITGIRWVSQFRNKTYSNKIASKLFAELEQTIQG